ncbi:MAG: Gfo/Idh/MocA family protein [Micromonosporaceae bacterium]
MRVGVVGCGYWGAKHVRVLTGLPEVAQVVAIDSRPERIEPIRRMYHSARYAYRLDEVIDDIDAAVIATPPRTHAPLAAQLLRAGKHVLIEKPMATSSDEARELIDLAEARGLVLMAGHTFEYNAAVLALRDVITSGELGTIYYIDAARLNLGLYQPDVNVIWDLAPHDISIINLLLDSVPRTVTAWGSRHAGSPYEDVAYLRLDYGEATANVHVSWLDPAKVRRVTVVGSKRMAVYNDLLDDARLQIFDKGVSGPVTEPDSGVPMSYRYGGISAPHIEFREPLATEDEHFVDCVRHHKTPDSDGYRGLGVVGVLEAAERSMRIGSAVEVPRTVPEPGRDPARTVPVS